MTVEHVGPGGVSNSYGVRTTTSKVVYENDNTYQDVFIPTGSIPVTATPSDQGPVFQVGDEAHAIVVAELDGGGNPTGNFYADGQQVDLGIPSETTAVETAATFATISASTSPRTVIVIADETNGGERTVYFHDGVSLNWIPAVEVE